MAKSKWEIATFVLTLFVAGLGAVSYQQQNTIASLNAQLQSLSTQANSRLADEARPDLPVRVGFRNALLGSGKVAVIENLSSRELQVTLEVTSAANGMHFQLPLVIEPNRTRDIGGHEGWEFASGQQVILRNTQYRPVSVTVGS